MARGLYRKVAPTDLTETKKILPKQKKIAYNNAWQLCDNDAERIEYSKEVKKAKREVADQPVDKEFDPISAPLDDVENWRKEEAGLTPEEKEIYKDFIIEDSPTEFSCEICDKVFQLRIITQFHILRDPEHLTVVTNHANKPIDHYEIPYCISN